MSVISTYPIYSRAPLDVAQLIRGDVRETVMALKENPGTGIHTGGVALQYEPQR